ncbi:MAG: DUF3800 domain-containing protein [Deltaproteobacteria bacterium]|nr:DUF3800 domain-containing protein [Deltaproteobacteria bacterium]
MNDTKTFNVYCDESCHLEHDRIPVMAWGAVFCEKRFVEDLSVRIRKLKVEFGLKPSFEAKWTKVSPAKTAFYLALLEIFLTDDRLQFRGLVVPDKHRLDHARFDQSHDDWYYKMYFTMLRPVFEPAQRYRFYLDLKDTRGGPKTRKLHEVLANSLHDFGREHVERVQQIRSDESELLQMSDLLIGALTYANRGLVGNQAKVAVMGRLRQQFGEQALTRTSPLASDKFNILVWRARDLAR